MPPIRSRRDLPNAAQIHEYTAPASHRTVKVPQHEKNGPVLYKQWHHWKESGQLTKTRKRWHWQDSSPLLHAHTPAANPGGASRRQPHHIPVQSGQTGVDFLQDDRLSLEGEQERLTVTKCQVLEKMERRVVFSPHQHSIVFAFCSPFDLHEFAKSLNQGAFSK